MEMNPRIQVEHAVTEQITGIDIVNEQLRIASGFPLSISQKEVILTGHAIELRVYTENPVTNFTPSSSPLLSINLPHHPDLRIESDINSNHSSYNQFDPLLLKLIASGKTRGETIALLRQYTKDLNIIGPETNVKYLEKILVNPVMNEISCRLNFVKRTTKY